MLDIKFIRENVELVRYVARGSGQIVERRAVCKFQLARKNTGASAPRTPAPARRRCCPRVLLREPTRCSLKHQPPGAGFGFASAVPGSDFASLASPALPVESTATCISLSPTMQ